MTLTTLYVAVALCVTARAAPPASPHFYQHPSQLQQINPVDYYIDNPDAVNYYSQLQQKQENVNAASNGAPARLETLEPDSEVELIPGAQPPQQPPQQTPVSPNIPGLVPGQRVFIVHMPVPGYRPGTIGGYQPVYIVAAAPQGNSYAANEFQQAKHLTVPYGWRRRLVYRAQLLASDINLKQSQTLTPKDLVRNSKMSKPKKI